MGAADIIARAQRIFKPFALDVKEVVWWSIYEIGHRLTRQIRRRARGAGGDARAARDAGRRRLPHHSPKAGRGMNVSMGDTFNLGWKLISVLTGRAEPALLHSSPASGARGQGPGGVRPQVGAWSAPAPRTTVQTACRAWRAVRRQPALHLRPDHPVRTQRIDGRAHPISISRRDSTSANVSTSAPVVRLPAKPKPGPLHSGRRAFPPLHLRAGGRCRQRGRRRRHAVRLARSTTGPPPLRRHGAGRRHRHGDRHRAVFSRASVRSTFAAMPTLLRLPVGRYGPPTTKRSSARTRARR